MGDTKKKTSKKTTKKAKKKTKTTKKKTASKVVSKPEPIKNRYVFRDQLDAINIDLIAEVVKNIKMLGSPKDRVDQLMKLMPYAYNKLDTIQMITPSQPVGGAQRSENGTEFIEGEVLDSNEKGEFDDILKNI